MIAEEEIQDIIERCKDAAQDGELSQWEEEFIASIEAQFEEKGTLSDGQIEKLEQIWEKI